MRDANPGTIYLKDYRPPAFSIHRTDLHFELEEDAAIVTSRLQLERNKAGNGPLELHGEELELLSRRCRRRGNCRAGTTGSDGESLLIHGAGPVCVSAGRVYGPRTTPRCRACTAPAGSSVPSARRRAFAGSPITWTGRT